MVWESNIEIVNYNPYKTRGKFIICVAYDLDIEDSYFENLMHHLLI